jgi:hypothetical protein
VPQVLSARTLGKEREAKPALVEPKSPVMQYHVCRSILEAASPRRFSGVGGEPGAFHGERPAMNRLKGMSWEPKRTQRLMSANAGSPTRGDPQGDGVAVVLKCSEQCPRHGEGQQATERLNREGTGREMHKSCSRLEAMGSVAGEPDAVKAARPGSEGGGRKRVVFRYYL